MKDKYYTPTIEEFHVGFEYEFKTNGLGFVKTEVSETGGFFQGEKRVKYLDREDIESLGFKCMGGNWYHDNKAYQIIGTWESIEISRGQHEYRDVLFKGTIKNKSELKRLLKMLGIYE